MSNKISNLKNLQQSEKFPTILALADNISPKFKQGLEQAIDQMTPSALEIIAEERWQIVGVHRIKDVSPDDDGVEIRAVAINRSLFIAEEYLNKNNTWIKTRVKSVLSGFFSPKTTEIRHVLEESRQK